MQARVRVIIIDLPTAVTSAVPDLINSAIRDIQTDHNFKAMEGQASYTTTVSTRALGAMPTRFKEYRGDPWYVRYADGSKHPVVLAANRDVLINAFTDNETGFPQAVTEAVPTDDVNTTGLEVWPLPDGNSDYTGGEYRLLLPYWRYFPDLSADGDHNWLTDNGEDAIVFQAASEGFALDWDNERMAVWAQKAQTKRTKLIKRDKLYRLSHGDVLVPHWRGQYDPGIKA